MEYNNPNTAMTMAAVFFVAIAVILIGGLAVIPMIQTTNAQGRSTDQVPSCEGAQQENTPHFKACNANSRDVACVGGGVEEEVAKAFYASELCSPSPPPTK